MSEQEIKKDKVWKRAGLFNTYEDALAKKNTILFEFPEHMIVKIKRYGQGGHRFQVKCWHPDYVKTKTSKKRKKND